MALRKTIFGRSKRSKTTFDNKTFYTGVNNVGNIAFSLDGVYLYVNWHSGYAIRQYTLSTPWNITTAVFTRQSSIAVSQSRGIWINQTGTMFFIADSATGVLKSYNMATPFNVNTMSAGPTLSTSGIYDCKFSDDGSILITGFNELLKKYNLSTPWDISTAVLSTSKAVAMTYSFCFSQDGKTVISLRHNSALSCYVTNVPYDINNLVFVNSITLPGVPAVSNFTGIVFSTDGLKMYWSGYSVNPNIYQLSNTIPNRIG